MTQPAQDPAENQVALTGTIEVAEIPLEEEFQQALVKANLTDQHIAEMMQEAMEVAAPIASHDQYQVVKQVRDRIAKRRIQGQKGIAEIHGRAVAWWKMSNNMKKELEARIQEPELMLDVHLTAWEQEQKRKAEEQQQAIIAMREQRKQDVMDLGYKFVPGPPEHKYVLEEVSIAMRDIMEMDHETWTVRFGQLRLKAEEVQEHEAAAEAARKAEEERIAAVAEQQRKAQEDLGRQRKELEAQQAKMNAMVNEARKNEMMTLGCAAWVHGTNGNLPSPCLQITSQNKEYFRIQENVLHTLSDEQWADEVRAAKLAMEQFRLDEQERLAGLRREAIIHERVAMLKAAGWEGNDPASGVGINFTRHVDGRAIVSARILLAQTILDMTDDEFSGAVKDGQDELARREQAAEAAAQAERERIAADAARKERERAEAAAAKAIEDEKNRQARLGDVEKWHEWVAAVKASAPKMDSEIGNHAIGRVIAGLEAMTPKLIDDLKK